MCTDNNEHKALFTIPMATHSSALVNIEPSPEQQKITRYKQADAYLQVLEVIHLNKPAHLGTAEVAPEEVKIPPEGTEECCARYLLANGGDPFRVAFSTVGMGSSALAVESVRENIKRVASVRAAFDSYEAVFENVEAKRVARSSPKFIDGCLWGQTPAEEKVGRTSGSHINKIDEQCRAFVEGYRGVIPEPCTLPGVVREFVYWGWLYSVRHSAGKELGYELNYSEHHESVYDCERYLEKLLATVKSVT